VIRPGHRPFHSIQILPYKLRRAKGLLIAQASTSCPGPQQLCQPRGFRGFRRHKMEALSGLHCKSHLPVDMKTPSVLNDGSAGSAWNLLLSTSDMLRPKVLRLKNWQRLSMATTLRLHRSTSRRSRNTADHSETVMLEAVQKVQMRRTSCIMMCLRVIIIFEHVPMKERKQNLSLIHVPSPARPADRAAPKRFQKTVATAVS
jgi:hypothetical protein